MNAECKFGIWDTSSTVYSAEFGIMSIWSDMIQHGSKEITLQSFNPVEMTIVVLPVSSSFASPLVLGRTFVRTVNQLNNPN